MGWFANGVSSGTALAEQLAPQGKTCVLDGVNVYIPGGAGTSAAFITLRTGLSDTGTFSSFGLAATTGGNVNIVSGSGGIIKSKYVGVAATTNSGTSNFVNIWGHYE